MEIGEETPKVRTDQTQSGQGSGQIEPVGTGRTLEEAFNTELLRKKQHAMQRRDLFEGNVNLLDELRKAGPTGHGLSPKRIEQRKEQTSKMLEVALTTGKISEVLGPVKR
jgi:hypothetical protein